MRFAHIADIHIGGWRDPLMRKYNIFSFISAIDKIIELKADFVILSGDLFNNAFPSIDSLKAVFEGFKKLRDHNIRLYLIPGSHDFSPNGRTMLDVIEAAGFAINVFKGVVEEDSLKLSFAVDSPTKTLITGILGKRGMLDKSYYSNIDFKAMELELSRFKGFKIFMFHTAINEIKPKDYENIDGIDSTILPKGFDYYAGGHIHYIFNDLVGDKRIVFPGALFPNNFKELERYKHGGFFFYDNGNISYQKISVVDVETLIIDAEGLYSYEILDEVISRARTLDLKDKIVTLRLFGKIEDKISDIDFRGIIESLKALGAKIVLRNIHKLSSKALDVELENKNINQTEYDIITKFLDKINFKTKQVIRDKESEREFINSFIVALAEEKRDGEKNHDYEKRILESINNLL